MIPQKLTLSILGPALAVAGLSSTAAASPPFTIELGTVEGTGCRQPDIVTVETNEFGEYFIDAKFFEGGDFTVETSGSQTVARKACTISYKLRLHSGYQLESADFLADGEYSLSENGQASARIRYKIPGIGSPSIAFQSFRADSGDDLDGVVDLVGKIYNSNIDGRLLCGGAIPLEVQVHATARKASSDTANTFIAIDNGEGQTGTSLIRCRVQVTPCP
jgi:hypothetical protein